MRGKTVKKINKAALAIINNTSEEERANTNIKKLRKKLKVHWKTQGATGRKFVNSLVTGNI
jgi:hypothetical protein